MSLANIVLNYKFAKDYIVFICQTIIFYIRVTNKTARTWIKVSKICTRFRISKLSPALNSSWSYVNP